MADAVRQPPSQDSWTRRVIGALLLLVGIAIGARLVWNLLAPLVPELVTAVVLLVIYRVIIWRRWR